MFVYASVRFLKWVRLTFHAPRQRCETGRLFQEVGSMTVGRRSVLKPAVHKYPPFLSYHHIPLTVSHRIRPRSWSPHSLTLAHRNSHHSQSLIAIEHPTLASIHTITTYLTIMKLNATVLISTATLV